MIKQFETLLATLNSPMTVEEENELLEYAKNININLVETTEIAHAFYKSQCMDYHADLTRGERA